MKTLIHLLHDDSGASAAEYALILAIVGSGIALAAFNLGGSIQTALGDIGDCMDGTTPAGTC